MTFNFDELFGNEDLKDYLSGVISSGNIPSTFIIEGDTGSGRKTLVRLFFKTISCKSENRPCGVCPSCKRIENGNSGDIRYFGITEGKKSIGVEDSRKIKDDCLLGPSDGDHKFYVITDADKLTPAAQNALLKITEEPPDFAKFFFVCESGMSLLPTLRSRSVTLRMQKFTDGMIADYLISREKKASRMKSDDPERFEDIVSRSGGSIGRALSLLRKRSADPDAASELAEALISYDLPGVHSALLSLPETRRDYKEALDEIRGALKQRMTSVDPEKKGAISEFYSAVEEEYENCGYNVSIAVSKRYLALCAKRTAAERG